jgi:GT2 family glycosyltransferase
VHNHNHTPQAEEVKKYIEGVKLSSCDNSLQRVVKIFNKHNRGVAGGRNDGLYRAKGKYKMYIDDDILLPDSYMEEMIKIFKKIPEIGTVGVTVENQDWPVKIKNGVTFQHKKGNIGGACAMIAPDVFERLGYLCQDYGTYGLEDPDLYYRLKAINRWNVYLHPMKAKHIDPENDPEYRKFKNRVYEKGSKPMVMFTRNKQKYDKGHGLYIPYKPGPV